MWPGERREKTERGEIPVEVTVGLRVLLLQHVQKYDVVPMTNSAWDRKYVCNSFCLLAVLLTLGVVSLHQLPRIL